jgi:ribose 5-phosphate isomerase B
MRIVVGNDHIGFLLKAPLVQLMQERGHLITDVGSFSDERTDYPIFAEAAARKVQNGDADFGVLLCGTGVGVSIAANKLNGIRCVVCTEPYSAALSRRHNNANMIALGARILGQDMAKLILETFLDEAFEGGRHAQRVDMITALETRAEKIYEDR